MIAHTDAERVLFVAVVLLAAAGGLYLAWDAWAGLEALRANHNISR